MCNHKTIVWESCGNRVATIRGQSRGNRVAITWQSHANHVAITWQSHGPQQPHVDRAHLRPQLLRA
eukprot:6586372-Prymnesium_polylepis.1